MPNKEGGYGGYQRKPDRQRQVRAPGSSGGVRRVPPRRRRPQPDAPQPGRAERQQRPAARPPRPTTAAAGLPRPLCAAHRRRG